MTYSVMLRRQYHLGQVLRNFEVRDEAGRNLWIFPAACWDEQEMEALANAVCEWLNRSGACRRPDECAAKAICDGTQEGCARARNQSVSLDLTERELKALMKDPAYHRDQNPGVIERVRKGFIRIYGEKK